MSNSQFPGQIDQLFDPVPTTQFDDPNNPHHLIESRQNDAITALEVKVGVNSSSDSNSLDFKITQMIRANGWLGGIVPNPSEFQSPVQFDSQITAVAVVPAFIPANAQKGAILVVNPVGGSNGPFISLAQLTGPSGAQTLVRAVALGVSADGLDAITNGAGPINIIDAITAKLVTASLTNPNNGNLFLCGSNPPAWVAPPSGGGGGAAYLTTFNPFTIPAVGSSVAVTVGAPADIIQNAGYLLTDGTHFMNAVAVTVAGTSITLLNVGCGGATSGSMAGGHLYAGNVAGPATATLGGSVPVPPNSTAKWFRGDAVWTSIAASDVLTALGYTPANKAGEEFSGFVVFDAGVKLQTAGALYILVPTVAPSSANVRSGQVQLTNVAGDGLGPTLSLTRVGTGGTNLNAGMLYLDGSGIGVVTDTAGPQNIITTGAQINPLAVPAPTTSLPGIMPALPPASGAGSQTKTWLRGDSTWQQLPEVNYLSAPFIVPAIGSTVVVQFYGPPYPAWPGIGAAANVYFSDGTARGWLGISAYNSSNGQLTLINRGNATAGANVGVDCLIRLGTPAIAATGIPGLLNAPSGNTTDFLDGTNSFQNLVNAITPTITLIRQRAYNIIGNPNFEYDNRNGASGVTVPAGGGFYWALDRWAAWKPISGAFSFTAGQGGAGGGVQAVGTGFNITTKVLYAQVTAQQATLAAGDAAAFIHYPEGVAYRELTMSGHSLGIQAYTNVAGGLKFSVALLDANNAYSLVKLCNIPAAGAWSLFQFPNLPNWPAGGTFNNGWGTQAYQIFVCFACGSTYMAPAADVWNAGRFYGAPGMGNLAAAPVGSYLWLAFCQHEAGPYCTPFLDKPWPVNQDECLRFFCKSTPYGVKPGTGVAGAAQAFALGGQSPIAVHSFPKTMAKVPTMTGWSDTSGAINNVHDDYAGVDRAITGAYGSPSDNHFLGFSVSGANASSTYYSYHWQADTNW